MLRTSQPKAEDAGEIALKLLSFLAGDADQLGRFMALSGLSPQDVRQNLQEPQFQAGLLDFALSDESLLLAFAANEGLDPGSVMRARSRLPGFSG